MALLRVTPNNPPVLLMSLGSSLFFLSFDRYCFLTNWYACCSASINSGRMFVTLTMVTCGGVKVVFIEGIQDNWYNCA